MTTKVTKESLAENIGRLESYGDLSLNEEYQLKAYRMLLVKISEDELKQYRSPTTLCFRCQQYHPIGVTCPFNNITS